MEGRTGRRREEDAGCRTQDAGHRAQAKWRDGPGNTGGTQGGATQGSNREGEERGEEGRKGGGGTSKKERTYFKKGFRPLVGILRGLEVYTILGEEKRFFGVRENIVAQVRLIWESKEKEGERGEVKGEKEGEGGRRREKEGERFFGVRETIVVQVRLI
jgi:hypothetical protein